MTVVDTYVERYNTPLCVLTRLIRYRFLEHLALLVFGAVEVPILFPSPPRMETLHCPYTYSGHGADSLLFVSEGLSKCRAVPE